MDRFFSLFQAAASCSKAKKKNKCPNIFRVGRQEIFFFLEQIFCIGSA